MSRSTFQALIGTVETRTRRRHQASRGSVSSPHRYCRNTCGSDTFVYVSHVSSPHRYCRNVAYLQVCGLTNRFQALIGTVETRERSRLARRHAHVSSPHRYCRNGHARTVAKLDERVSSPHRYCRNCRSRTSNAQRYPVSSPHRYCRNPEEPGIKFPAPFCFKPS